MGIDLNGWVEVRPYPDSVYKATREAWHGVIKANSIAHRNYDLFGCLFGITNYGGFRPVFDLRGLPGDLSEEAQDDYLTWDEAFAETWITWEEISVINWEERAEAVDGRPHRYERQADGSLLYRDKSSPTSLDREAGRPMDEEGATWERDGFLYRIERMSRHDAMRKDWQLLFDLMARIASEYSPEHTRLVVWFDR